MSEASFVNLIQNVALLLALVLIFDLAAVHWQPGRPSIRQVPVGFLIGAMGVVLMLTPWVFVPGIIFDTRSILLGMSGLFFGSVPTLTAMILTAAFRFYQGGNGALTGSLVIFATGSLGVLWRHIRRRPLDQFSWVEFYLFGLVIHVVMLALMFTLPGGAAASVLTSITLPVLMIYPLGTALLGTLMSNQVRRKNLLEQIKENETRFQIVADNTYDWEYWLSPAGQFVYCSPSCHLITGHEREEFFQDAELLYRIIHPEDRALFEQHQCHSAECKVGQLEFRIVWPDGSIRWIGHVCAPVYDAHGQFQGTRGSNRDITERKEVGERLAQSEALLHRSQQQAGMGSFIWSLSDDTLYWSRNMYAIHGIDPEDCIGRLGEVSTQLIHPEDRPRVNAEIERMVASGQVWSMEFRVLRPDGGERVMQSNGEFEFDAQGRPVRCIGIHQDITERKQAEEKMRAVQSELERLLAEAERSRRALLSVVEDERHAREQIHHLNSELEQRVRARTLQLEAANHELEAFSYSVSHDLRAPLRALDGFSSMLSSDYQDRLDEKGQHYLNRIQEASRQMSQLIDDLLRLSKISLAECVYQSVDLSALAHEIMTEIQERDGNCQVEYRVTPGMVVQGDVRLLKIALGNLIDNACKFTARCSRPQIEVGVSVQTGEPVYFVRDNGAGFDMAYAAKLFAPFQRLHAARDYPGTGIGLSIVQRIITRHGGRIWAEAARDEGATFYFTLGSQ